MSGYKTLAANAAFAVLGVFETFDWTSLRPRRSASPSRKPVSAWISIVLACLQLAVLIARYLERAKLLSEADAQATARLLQVAKDETARIKTEMDDAARRATPAPGVPVNDDPFERD
jgi:hypothetical protein